MCACTAGHVRGRRRGHARAGASVACARAPRWYVRGRSGGMCAGAAVVCAHALWAMCACATGHVHRAAAVCPHALWAMCTGSGGMCGPARGAIICCRGAAMCAGRYVRTRYGAICAGGQALCCREGRREYAHCALWGMAAFHMCRCRRTMLYAHTSFSICIACQNFHFLAIKKILIN